MFIGIDNGVSGGIVGLDHRGEVLLARAMPICKEFQRRRVDAVELAGLLKNATMVVYERPTGSQSASAAASMADSFAVVDTVLRVNNIRRLAITSQKWQKHYWSKVDDTKAEALRVANGLWPSENWLATERSKKPHDGIVDAALIAYWAKTKA